MMHHGAYHGRSFSRNSVLTITGNDVVLRVKFHGLEVLDGFKAEGESRKRYVHRAVSQPDRVLLLATSGTISLSALDWCGENGVPVVCCDQAGDIRFTLLPGKGGEWACRSRRALAIAPFSESGLKIAKWLIIRKITGQRDSVRALGQSSDSVEGFLSEVEHARTIPHLRYLEARAADAYWRGWGSVSVHFAPPSYLKKIPGHWATFRGRGSPISNGPRNAADPVNALLNYAYALLEAEARIACYEAGLDPYLGILHTDQDARRSLIYDVMEPVRPVADRLVLNLVRGHAFRPGELWNLPDGRCRLDQDLCAHLWPWMPQFRRALGPVMTFLVGRLREGPRYTERTGLRLTETTPPVKTRAPLGQKRWARETDAPPLRSAAVCRSCGVLLEDLEGRLYCDHCFQLYRKMSIASMSDAGRETLGRLRQQGSDPAHGGEAARTRGRKIARHNRELARWQGGVDATSDPDTFRREILPGLRRVPLQRIAQAVGISEGYASFIRRGVRVPHPRHWESLARLVFPEKGCRLSVNKATQITDAGPRT